MLYGIYFKGMCSFDVQDHLKKTTSMNLTLNVINRLPADTPCDTFVRWSRFLSHFSQKKLGVSHKNLC